jgi:glycosyltransferase involved in cell wall biosynthesis
MKNEKMGIDISVIMPIYNGNKWVSNTLKNLSKQTFQNFEVIIINDGSTDNTQSIVEEFCEVNPNFRLYNKPNGGVASARNMGLEKARGEYIIHHDVDDGMPTDALDSLFKCAVINHSDIVIGDYAVWSFKIKKRINQSFNCDSLSFIQGLLNNRYHGSLCNKLIKSEVYRGVSFEENIDHMEDKLLLIRLLLKRPSIRYLPKVVYYYYADRGGSGNEPDKALQSYKRIIELLQKDFCDNGLVFDLNWQKIGYKKFAILNNQEINHKQVFKEVNDKIFKLENLPIVHRFLLYFELNGIHFFSNIYTSIRQMKRRILKSI